MPDVSTNTFRSLKIWLKERGVRNRFKALCLFSYLDRLLSQYFHQPLSLCVPYGPSVPVLRRLVKESIAAVIYDKHGSKRHREIAGESEGQVIRSGAEIPEKCSQLLRLRSPVLRHQLPLQSY